MADDAGSASCRACCRLSCSRQTGGERLATRVDRLLDSWMKSESEEVKRFGYLTKGKC